METRRVSRVIEVNTMAILDASGLHKGSQELIDDRIAFLEAVRSATLVPDNGIAPTNKMFEAIFEIMKDENSLELLMASYHLLIELEKHFPRVYTPKVEASSLPSTSNVPELVVIEEAWSPFMFGSDGYRENACKNSGGWLDPSGFHLLIEDLAKVAIETKFEKLEVKSLRNMLLVQYLITVLEGDFTPRNSMCKENMDWKLLRESLLNMLLASRRMNFKTLIKDFLSIMCEMPDVGTEISYGMRSPENSIAGTAIAISFPEVKNCTSSALQKFLLMAMELDISKKKAEMLGLTTRADGARAAVLDIIHDELSYNRSSLSPFFQVFVEPKWKLEIIIKYFQKYITKRSVRTRQSNDPIYDATFDGILKCFSNSNTAKSITKKISTEVVQLLLAHAFQAFLALPSQHSPEGVCHSKDVKDSSLVEICKNLIYAFTNLRRIDEHAEIMSFGKEALFIAGTILSMT
ncbi:hypothetical protein NMG60_11014913 [Bertholletia excelsa]